MQSQLYNDPSFQRLISRVDELERRMRTTATAASAAKAGTAASAKRFRIGVFKTGLVALGGQVSGSVRWSSSITDSAGTPVAVYNVDAACDAMSNTRWTFTTSNMSADGVTITFTAPVALALGSTVVVLGVAPAS